MKIRSFQISNFKGIQDCLLNIESTNADNQIITLIGLNESGKTTILEALANCFGKDEELLAAMGTMPPKPELKEFIPKHRKANFTGAIELEANVIWETAQSILLKTTNSTQINPRTSELRSIENLRPNTQIKLRIFNRSSTVWTIKSLP
jgi:recombinational DNA repair ATPase RecF